MLCQTREMDALPATNHGEACARIELRTNMFVLAAISALSASGPVKIRNLSSRGALIEGATLPSTGERVELRRGTRQASGRVAWCQNGKAGLRFDGRVDVYDWMPRGQDGQQLVDRVAEETKAYGATTTSSLADASASHLLAPAPFDLRKLARALDSLADDLAEDASITARLGSKLQTLDVVSQVLRRLSGTAA